MSETRQTKNGRRRTPSPRETRIDAAHVVPDAAQAAADSLQPAGAAGQLAVAAASSAAGERQASDTSPSGGETETRAAPVTPPAVDGAATDQPRPSGADSDQRRLSGAGSGITAGEVVVVGAPQDLHDGSRVAIRGT